MFKTIKVNADSTRNPSIIAKLDIKNGVAKHNSLALEDDNLIVVDNNTKSYLFNINAKRTLKTLLKPRYNSFNIA